jgi:hypothetical protein
MYTFVIFGTKVSIVLLYLRIWSEKRSMRLICWATLALLTAALIAYQVVAIVPCVPVSYLWKQWTNPSAAGTCIDRKTWAWAISGTLIGFDVLLILIPLQWLLKLDVSQPKKYG